MMIVIMLITKYLPLIKTYPAPPKCYLGVWQTPLNTKLIIFSVCTGEGSGGRERGRGRMREREEERDTASIGKALRGKREEMRTRNKKRGKKRKRRKKIEGRREREAYSFHKRGSERERMG